MAIFIDLTLKLPRLLMGGTRILTLAGTILLPPLLLPQCFTRWRFARPVPA